MEEKEVLLTQEGYDNLEKELEELKTVKRYEIAERIKVALGFGDLSENSEYDEAKNAQAANETKIAELENKLRYARIIDESEIDTKTVQVGNIVTLLDMEFDEEVEYTIVGTTEVDLSQNKMTADCDIYKVQEPITKLTYDEEFRYFVAAEDVENSIKEAKEINTKIILSSIVSVLKGIKKLNELNKLREQAQI